MAKRGRLITFEGIDGSGKSTQIGRLIEALRGKGIECETFREPGGTRFGESIRGILLAGKSPSGEAIEFGGLAEALLFMAARAELMRQVVAPMMERGVTVVLDRFTDSTIAYQAFGRGIDRGFLDRVNRAVTSGIEPDLTLFLDIPVEAALARINRGHDRMEAQGVEFLQRVRNGYLTIAREDSMRFVTIDGSLSEDVIAEVCLGMVMG